MLGRDHLGKASGFGRIFFMTAPAEVGHVGQGRFVRRGIVSQGVRRLRAMARLAGDMCVLSRSADCGLLIVAHDALVLPGVVHRALANPLQGRRVVMTVFSEGFRNECSADSQEDAETGQQNQGGADQVSGFPKKLTQAETPLSGTALGER